MSTAAHAAVHVAIRAHDFASATLAKLRAQLRAIAARRVHIGLGDQTFGEQFRRIGVVASAIEALRYPVTALGNAAATAIPIITKYGVMIGLIGVAARAAVPAILQAAGAIGSALGILGLGGGGIAAAAYIEQIEARFLAVSRNTDLARQRLEDYKRLARETGASFSAMVEASIAARTAGIDLRYSAMQSLISAAQILDGNADKISQYGDKIAQFVRSGEKFELGNFIKWNEDGKGDDKKQYFEWIDAKSGRRMREQVAADARARAEQIARIMESAVPAKAVTLWDQIKSIVNSIIQSFAKVGEAGLLKTLKEQMESIRQTFERAFSSGQLDRIGAKIAEAFKVLLNLDNANFGSWLQGILDTMEKMDWKKLAQDARDFFTIDLPGFWANLVKIYDKVTEIVGKIADLLNQGAELIGWDAMLVLIGLGFTGLLGPIAEVTTAIAGIGLKAFKDLIKKIVAKLVAMEIGLGTAGVAVTGFAGSFSVATRTIRAAIRKIPIIGWLIAIAELVIWLAEVVYENWDGISRAITGAWNWIVDVADRSWKWLKKQVEDVWDWLDKQTKPLREAGQKLFDSFWDGLKDVWNKITAWIEDKILWLTRTLIEPLRQIGLVSDETAGKIDQMRQQAQSAGQVGVNVNIAGLPQGSSAAMTTSGSGVIGRMNTGYSPYPVSGGGSSNGPANATLSGIAAMYR